MLPTALAAAGVSPEPAAGLDSVNLLAFLNGTRRGEPRIMVPARRNITRKDVTVADIQTLFEQRTHAWARRDPVALAEGYADDAIVTSPMFARAEGRTAIQQSFTALFHVFPDWQVSLEEPCVSGSRAMQACHIRATQRGDFMGIAGSGKRVEFDCVLIYDFENGRITRERRIYDFTGMLIQLGVLRSKPAV